MLLNFYQTTLYGTEQLAEHFDDVVHLKKLFKSQVLFAQNRNIELLNIPHGGMVM